MLSVSMAINKWIVVLVSRVSVMALMTVHETVNPNEQFLTVLVRARWKVRNEVSDQMFVFYWSRRGSPRKPSPVTLLFATREVAKLLAM